MIRNLKAFGLALGAIFAMGALSASAASATDFFTTSNGEPVLLTGTSHDHEFRITPERSWFRCTTSTFVGTAANGSSEATIDPTYTGLVEPPDHNTKHTCNSKQGAVIIDINGCHYKLTGNTTGSDEGKLDATVWIECEGTKKIQITSESTGVTISVPSQTPTEGGVTYTNLPNHPGGAAVQVKATATGVTYTCAPTFTCTLGGLPHHGNTADYFGTLTATGWEDKDGLPTPIEEGAQVGVSVS